MNIVFDDVSLAPPIEPVPGHTVELERLGDEIAELSAHLDAATARLLDLIRDFDARAAGATAFARAPPGSPGASGSTPGRLASTLGALPRLAQALARGELSYSKVRALTRVATPETEGRLLAVGKAGTA